MFITREKHQESGLIMAAGGRVSLHIYTFSLPFLSAYFLLLSEEK